MTQSFLSLGGRGSSGDEGELLFSGEGLDAEFFFAGFGAGSNFLAVDEFEREFTAGVFCAFGAPGLMLLEASIDVGGDAGVEGAVAAAEDVDGPGGRRHGVG